MTKIKALLVAAVLVAGFGAASATEKETKIECDETNIVCGYVGPVTVLGKATIIVPSTDIVAQ